MAGNTPKLVSKMILMNGGQIVREDGTVIASVNSDGTLTTSLTPSTVTTLTAASTITKSQNGSTFILSSATEFATTLPAPFANARYTFIVGAAPSGASYTIVTNASANIIKGQAYVCADAAGDAGTADDTITFVDGQAVAGDRLELWSDGTSWFASAFIAVAAGLTFTQAS